MDERRHFSNVSGAHQKVCTLFKRPSHIINLLDNHESHTSLASIDFARENGITLLTIPPQTSHRLQPLDITVFGPFKGAYASAIDGWMRSNPGKTVTIHDIPGVVKAAQEVSMTSRYIVSGFKSIGIYPFNRHIYTEDDFASADVYDQPILAEAMNTPNTFEENAEEQMANPSEQTRNPSDDGKSFSRF